MKNIAKEQKEKVSGENNAPLTNDLRQTLKTMMQRELEALPALLENLEPKERITVLCRIMPFILPKVVSVRHSEGEPNSDWDFLLS